MESNNQFSSVRSKKNVTLRIAVISTMLAVLMIIGGIIAYVQGYLVFDKNAKPNGVGHFAICNVQVVADYNKTLSADVEETSDGVSYQKSLIDFGKKVQAKSKYDTDPTCLYISARTYIEAGEYAKAKVDADKLFQLVQQGEYVNTLVFGLNSVQQLQNSIKGYQARSRE